MKNFIIFLAGLGLGSAVTWKLVENKYMKKADEEIQSVIDTFEERRKELEELLKTDSACVAKDENEEDPELKKDKEENKEIINDSKYNVNEPDMGKEDYTAITLIEKDNVVTKVKPYIITENEYGDMNFDEKTLLYYADDVLADDEDSQIGNPEQVVGNALSAFEEDPYLDRVYVRDENEEIDYVILKSEKTFSEIVGEDNE